MSDEQSNGNGERGVHLDHPIIAGFRHRAPEVVKPWIEDLSIDLGPSQSQIGNWYRGNNLPGLLNLETLFSDARFGRALADEWLWARFGWRVIADSEETPKAETGADLDTLADKVAERVLARLHGKVTALPVKGRVS